MALRSAATGSDLRGELFGLVEELHPGKVRARTLARLDELFRGGSVPDPLPDGFHPGRLLATSTYAPLDAAVRRLADAWMPWQGKTFDRSASTGFNRFTPSVRLPLRAVWPSYRPVFDDGKRIEAFEFRNRVGPGALDPDLQVFKIDYDFPANPSFIIRPVLDELVQIEDGLYLGKVLMRVRGRFRATGFFSLER